MELLDDKIEIKYTILNLEIQQLHQLKYTSRWWQLKCFWNFHPELCGEEFPFWRSHFSKGWFNHQPDLFANSHLRNRGSLPLAIHIFSGRILWKAGRFSFGTPKNPGGLVMVFGTKNDTSTASPPDGERPSSQIIFGFRALFSRSRSPWW